MSKNAVTKLRKPDKINLLDLDRQAMEAFFSEMGEKAFRTSQVMKWLYHLDVMDIETMTNLSKDLRARLQHDAFIDIPEIVSDQLSSDGTRKWLFKLADGNAIETVFIPEEGRGTLCVSSQAGCPLECAFCSTGKQGFSRNLSTAEIIAQVCVANRCLGGNPNTDRVITNVVLMGMGEPLLNFDAVVRATNVLMDDFGFGLSKRRVTLSTAGIVPAIYRLAEVSEVSLAVSLHAVTDELRNQIVPINRKYPLEKLLAACKHYIGNEKRRKVTIEYVMLKGVNDSPNEARKLVRLLQGIPSKMNLIPFNPFPGSPYLASDEETIDQFRNILIRAGITTVTRRTRGEDIDAACGQLVGRIDNKMKKHVAAEGDILGVCS